MQNAIKNQSAQSQRLQFPLPRKHHTQEHEAIFDVLVRAQ
jgi:hypothetical protein